MAFGPTNGFIYTIIDRKELQRRKTSVSKLEQRRFPFDVETSILCFQTGPTSATMYEHRLSTNMPHYTRQEEVLKEKLKTPISQTNLIKASGTALTAGQTFDVRFAIKSFNYAMLLISMRSSKIFDHVRITKNLKVEVAGMSGTREYKAGQMLKVVGDPGSGRVRICTSSRNSEWLIYPATEEVRTRCHHCVQYNLRVPRHGDGHCYRGHSLEIC